MSRSTLNSDHVDAVAAHLASAEAVMHTAPAVEMRARACRYRLGVGLGAAPVRVFSRRGGDWQVDANCLDTLPPASRTS